MPWLTAVFAALAIAERKRPLRKPTQPLVMRVVRNAALGAAAWAAIECGTRVLRLHRPRRRAADPLSLLAEVMLLDYTLWWWHRWNHEWPMLWRFHAAHHADRDLDTSTGIRFHPAEQFLAQFFRWAQIRLIQPSDLSLRVWESLLLTSIFFHHSNLRLPSSADSRIAQWFVTPRMHGIHHADDATLSRSNYASLLTWWDSVHGTLRLDVPQEDIVIGLPNNAD